MIYAINADFKSHSILTTETQPQKHGLGIYVINTDSKNSSFLSLHRSRKIMLHAMPVLSTQISSVSLCRPSPCTLGYWCATKDALPLGAMWLIPTPIILPSWLYISCVAGIRCRYPLYIFLPVFFKMYPSGYVPVMALAQNHIHFPRHTQCPCWDHRQFHRSLCVLVHLILMTCTNRYDASVMHPVTHAIWNHSNTNQISIPVLYRLAVLSLIKFARPCHDIKFNVIQSE